jgi:hypothetical protein
VLRLRHWPPRGVYTRWRPRKLFAPASGVYHQHLQESYPFSVSPSVQNWTFGSLFFVIFLHPPLRRWRHVKPYESTCSKTEFSPRNVPSPPTWQTPVTCRLRACLRVRILTPGHQKGGRVARYFLLSLAFNSSCENRATGVQQRLTRLRFR